MYTVFLYIFFAATRLYYLGHRQEITVKLYLKMSSTALDLAFFLLDLTELSEQVTEEFAGVDSSFYIQ